MKVARTFEDLLVWRKAHQFVLDVYRLTATFPKSETYGLASQMRRAAVSIPANIAEGFKRRTRIEKARFLMAGPSATATWKSSRPRKMGTSSRRRGWSRSPK